MDRFIKKFYSYTIYKIDSLIFLEKPNDFYNKIKEYSNSAKEMCITTLFMGTSGRSLEIYDILLERKKSGRKTVIILDKHRMTRDDIFTNLIECYGITEQFVYYDTGSCPLLPNILKEIVSVLHSKIYIFDETVILSGANLDDSYFSTRLDRYIEVRADKFAADLKNEVFNKLAPYKLVSNSTLSEYTNFSNQNSYIIKFDRDNEFEILTKLMAEDWDEIFLSTAYLNLTSQHCTLFKNKKIKIILPSHSANTFRYDRAAEKFIVDNYTLSTIKMIDEMKNIEFYEYKNGDETFHCKGLWCFRENMGVSIIGSTNFNVRSVYRDIETNFMIATCDNKYIDGFRKELNSILKYTNRIDLKEIKRKSIGRCVKFGWFFAKNYL